MNYWDSSALIEAVFEPALMRRLRLEEGCTRAHAFAETFSVLTGNPEVRIPADVVSTILEDLRGSLIIVEIDAPDIIGATARARALGVRGARIHDLLHAVAAEKSGATRLITLDKNDFGGLTNIEIEIL